MKFCFRILLFVVVLSIMAAEQPACGEFQNLDLMARTGIGRITSDGDPEDPLDPDKPETLHRKSVARAMILSALLPGLGQIYAGGKRAYIVGGTMGTIDLFSVWKYVDNNSKGDDKKSEYEKWAQDHYSRSRFEENVCDTVSVFSGYEDLTPCAE